MQGQVRSGQINIFFSEEDACYVADIPDLQYCSAFGDTPQEALEELLIARRARLEVAEENRTPDRARRGRGRLVGIDHVQLTVTPGEQNLDMARRFYADLLGLQETPKPPELVTRGGIWFRGPGFEVHLGVEEPTDTRRHPGFMTEDLPALRARLQTAGILFEDQPPLGDR